MHTPAFVMQKLMLDSATGMFSVHSSFLSLAVFVVHTCACIWHLQWQGDFTIKQHAFDNENEDLMPFIHRAQLLYDYWTSLRVIYCLLPLLKEIDHYVEHNGLSDVE